MGDFNLGDVLHTIGQAMNTPCIVILLLLMVAAVWQLGGLVVEWFVERRRDRENVAELVKKIQAAGKDGMSQVVEESRLLKRHKKLLRSIIEAGYMQEESLTAYAQKLLGDEEKRCVKDTAATDLIAKLGPMFGLLGTLIPLGPGIVALGMGDTATLSASLGTAFDTTIAGVLAAALALVISNIRHRWYDGYLDSCEALVECVLAEALARK